MKLKLVAASLFVAMFMGWVPAHAATAAAGDVFSFGDNSLGRTGLGTGSGITRVATAIDTSNLGGLAITQLAAGGLHSRLLAEDGTVFSFGWNDNGRTGQGTTFGITPVATPINTSKLGGRAITQVAAGGFHSLLLAEDGTVFSFGDNNVGATGLGTFSGSTLVATPIDTSNLGGLTITQVATGGGHSLLLAEDGTVFSFGTNVFGATGRGTTSGFTSVATPIDASNLGGLTIKQVSAGSFHSLLLAEDGSVFAFGDNGAGRTGLGTASFSATTVATPIDTSNLGGRAIKQVSAGSFHSLLLAEDGSVFAFGTNSFGRTGLGTTNGSTTVATPIDTSNLGGRAITQVAAGFEHSLLLAEDGTVFSFGWNDNGRTGQGTVSGDTLVATPINVSNLGGRAITQVAAGSSHSLLVAALVGDLDGDGFVGIPDLNIVLGNWNQNVTPGDLLQGDPSGDGFVGIEDLNQVLGNWNAGAPPSLKAVPEPGTLAVAGPMLLGMAVRRKKPLAVSH